MFYLIQYFRLAIGDTDNNVIASDSSLAPSHHTGNKNEKWYVNYQSENVFKIGNASNNKLLTSSEDKVSLSDDSDSEEQKWKIEGVEKDYDGYFLYYTISSNSDSSKFLTYTANKGFSLEKYSGKEYQHFKINLDGLEGFGANCKTSLGEKAGLIGGLLGPSVISNTKDEFIAAINSDGPKTIHMNANFDLINDKNTRIRDYKTICGSLRYKSIYNGNFRTNDPNGKDAPSDNIIFRNIDFEIREDADRTLLNIFASRQIWIDHCIFSNTIDIDAKGDGSDCLGEFVWINTPDPNKPDEKYADRSPDYITVSYCIFGIKFWCFESGTQNNDKTRNRITFSYNGWYSNVRRCPEVGNGCAHIYNNFYFGKGQKDNGDYLAQIIGGEGSEILSQNNMFEGF